MGGRRYSGVLMSQTLPDFIDVRRAAELGVVLAGRVALRELPRLRETLLDEAGEAECRLAFSQDEARRSLVLGEVAATLVVRCERCLGPMRHRVEAEVSLALASGLDEAERIPERFDPLVLEDGRARPLDLIEDELLLGLPQIPMHAPAECSVQLPQAPKEPAANPFAVLGALRDKR